MEFTLICPNDGRIELGLENMTALVFKGAESVEVIFECPRCGTSLRAALNVPNLLSAALELAHHVTDGEGAGVARPAPTGQPDAAERTLEDRAVRVARERQGEAYCEYFRRQLAGVRCVEDFLDELGE